VRCYTDISSRDGDAQAQDTAVLSPKGATAGKTQTFDAKGRKRGLLCH